MACLDDSTLKQYLSTYQHAEAARRDVLSLINAYRSLAPRLEAFVFNNGSRKDLLHLAGTLPVYYKGAVYNIPVCIWLMDTHPHHAPLAFVKPTPDMAIKVSKYVDSNGKVYLPYLHEWNASGSTLLGLCQRMITAFSELPPVYAKPRQEQPASLPYPVSSFMPQPGGAYTPPYPAYPYPQPGPVTSTGAASGASGTITEEHIRASLLSAVEDKLRRRLAEQGAQAAAELETLRRTQHELQEGATRLDEVVAGLRRERAGLERGVATLQEKARELEESAARLDEQASGAVPVDEAVQTTAPLYHQLLDAFAEEATLEDAMYYMGEALRKERIDLDTFLKQVRSLARTQFTLRALMHRCRQRARLAC